VEKLEDILTRFGNKIANAGEQGGAGQGAKPHLLPDRHPVRDFFVADILEWALKDDHASMEHPMFSLSKTTDTKIRHYEHNGNTITIEPSRHGMPTIWDKDILIYAVSQLVEGLNQGRPIARKVRLTAYDFLVTTNRYTGGENYKRLEAAFDRLAGTRIRTNIATNGMRVKEGFGLIDNWKIVQRSADGRMIAVEITLNEWLYNAILGREVLTLSRDYFRLDGGLERRLYELARKHCGQQDRWVISLTLLHLKSGSIAPLKTFRQRLKRVMNANALPDYHLSYRDDTDQAIFERRTSVYQSPTSVD
jgi:plasmid replication initiation protein